MTRRAEPTELRTARLTLRPWRAEDVDAYLAILSDPEYAHFAVGFEVTRARVEQMVARAIAAVWAEQPRFAVVYEGALAGNAELAVDGKNAVGQLGYGIARPLWGRGLATEAASAVVAYGFAALGLAKVFAWVDPRNTRSVRVLEKLGMRREALLRRHRLHRGERVDRAGYGLLREEWEAVTGTPSPRAATAVSAGLH